MKPERFLATHWLFTRAELVEHLRPGSRSTATVDSHLARWRREGRIARVKQGLFLRLDPPGEPRTYAPDFHALASRMAPDAALAHHTALEILGHAQSLFERLTFVTWTKTKPMTYEGRRFVPVRPRASLLAADGGERWIERTERSGVEVRVTNLERTVADVLDRPGLSGGTDEVWRSLSSIPALDLRLLEGYVVALRSRTLAAKVGFFLESRREELVVTESLLDRLRALAPSGPVYLDRRRGGRLVSRWGLVVPTEFVPGTQGEPV